MGTKCQEHTPRFEKGSCGQQSKTRTRRGAVALTKEWGEPEVNAVTGVEDVKNSSSASLPQIAARNVREGVIKRGTKNEPGKKKTEKREGENACYSPGARQQKKKRFDPDKTGRSWT